MNKVELKGRIAYYKGSSYTINRAVGDKVNIINNKEELTVSLGEIRLSQWDEPCVKKKKRGRG